MATQIYTVADLQDVNLDVTASYVLMNDLDLARGHRLCDRALSAARSTGKVNVIRNWTYSGGNSTGFFREVTGTGVVENLGIEDADVTAAPTAAFLSDG